MKNKHTHTRYWPRGDLLLGVSVRQVFMGSTLWVGNVWRCLTQLQSSYKSIKSLVTHMLVLFCYSATKDLHFCQQHWSHWLLYFDLAGSDLPAEGSEGMSRHIYNSRTWASIKGIQRRETRLHQTAIKAASKHLILNNDKQRAPALTASINKTPGWKLRAVFINSGPKYLWQQFLF